MSTEAEAAKAEGNAKLQANDPHGAIKCFTKAIELDSTNHIYYSNRSAAFLRIGDVDAAVKDANKCISVNPSWAKGHARKGRALFEKKLFGQAAEAYKKASELDPTNELYKEYVLSMQQEDRYVRGIDKRPGTSTSTPSATPPTSNPRPTTSPGSSGSSLREVLFSTPAKMRYTAFNALRIMILICGVSYLASGGMMKVALICTALLYAGQLIEQHGRPQLSQAYAQQVLPDWRSHYVLMSLLFLSLQPRFILLLPALSHELGNIAEFFMNVLPHISPRLLAIGTGFVNNTLMPKLTSTTADEWSRYSLSTKWQRHNTVVLAIAANFEVGILLMLIVDLFTSQRNLIGLFAYAQFLRMRYMASPELQAAFSNLDSRISPFITRAPVIGPYYVRTKAYLANWVDPAAQAANAGSRPSCSIQ